MAAFLANVGVNAGHAARSPLFDDGTFELLPIPERRPWRRPMLRLGDLPHLRRHAPASWRNTAIHLDPDLTSTTPTYGDNCRRVGRAYSLRKAQPGDVIVFLARLHPRSQRPAFHLVGCLEIADVLEDVTEDPGPGWWDANAHIRRARAIRTWDAFWVFKGGKSTRLLHRAIPFARQETQTLFSTAIHWPEHRTELQTIGSYTRAVRRIDGEAETWLRTICQS